MTEYERETKLQLNRDDFNDLLQEGEIVERTDQLNIYFDSDHELSQAAATFRIRLYSPSANPAMTLKLPVQNGSSIRTCMEVETTLDEGDPKVRFKEIDVAQQLPQRFSVHLKRLGVQRLQRLGCMRTDRHLVRIGKDLIVEMDRVRLPDGKNFFEIEFESDDLSEHERALRLIRSKTTSASQSRLSKYERCVESLADTPQLYDPA
jgi:uncharacterized protein YjbK